METLEKEFPDLVINIKWLIEILHITCLWYPLPPYIFLVERKRMWGREILHILCNLLTLYSITAWTRRTCTKSSSSRARLWTTLYRLATTGGVGCELLTRTLSTDIRWLSIRMMFVNQPDCYYQEWTVPQGYVGKLLINRMLIHFFLTSMHQTVHGNEM